MLSSVNLLSRDSLFAQVLLAKFVSVFSSSVASSDFSYFFPPSLIYELLSLAGRFKEIQIKVPLNLLTTGGMRNARPLLGSWPGQLEKARTENEEHFCHSWFFTDISPMTPANTGSQVPFLMQCNNEVAGLGYWPEGNRPGKQILGHCVTSPGPGCSVSL